MPEQHSGAINSKRGSNPRTVLFLFNWSNYHAHKFTCKLRCFLNNTTFFQVFGINPLFLYVSSEVFVILFGRLGISGSVYDGIHSVVSYPQMASLCYALCFVLFLFIIGYILYRRHIYINL